MKQLSTYIEQLLSNYECVVIPGFGGFVANHKSAVVNSLQGKFMPPSKVVSFNRNLKNNDGLLANYIASEEGLSYDKAVEEIKLAVQELVRKLKTDKSVILSGLGQLFVDINGSIRFEPSLSKNLLLDSFGLTTFNLIELPQLEKEIQPIKEVDKEESKEEKVEQKSEAKVIPIKLPEQKNWKTVIKKVGYAAALIPFVAYLLWLPLKTELFKGNNFSYADLNPFTDKICPEYKMRAQMVSVVEEDASNNLLEKLNTSDKEVVEIALFESQEEAFDEHKTLFVRLKNIVAEPESTMVSVSKKQIFKFHIIAGCFGDYKNAERLAAKLRKKGFSSGIIDQNKGLYRVAFQSFTTREEALSVLASVKKDQNPNAWLLVK